MLIVGFAVGLIVAGLLTCFLSDKAGRMATPFWWVGIVLAVCGVALLIAPLVLEVDAFLRRVLSR